MQATSPPFPPPKLQKAQTFFHAVYWYKLIHWLHVTRIHYLIINAGTAAIYLSLIKQHIPRPTITAAELTTENILCREPYAAAACCWVLRASAKLLALVLLLLKAGIVACEYKLRQRKRSLGRKLRASQSPASRPSLWAQLHKFLFCAD